MRDSGICTIGDDIWFTQLEHCAMTVCAKQRITDAEWRTYLNGTFEVGQRLGHFPTVSIIQFEGASPNATQRKVSQEFIDEHKTPMGRVALVTDQMLIRGAMTAFSWVAPKTQLRAFAPDDLKAAFQWLDSTLPIDAAVERMRQMQHRITQRSAG